MLEEHSSHPLDLIALLRFGRCYGSKVCVMCSYSIPTLFQYFLYDHIPPYLFAYFVKECRAFFYIFMKCFL